MNSMPRISSKAMSKSELIKHLDTAIALARDIQREANLIAQIVRESHAEKMAA